MAKTWIIAPPADELDVTAQAWGVPPLVAQLLINRGVSPQCTRQDFMAPQLRDLHPPSDLPGAALAAELLADAIRRRHKIVLYGDYDVDGTTGVAILWHLLTLADADVTFYVPHRVEEGYGLSLAAAERLVAEGAQLIVSIDCGITAVETAESLRQKGVRLIITDHHTPHAVLPSAEAIVHPTVGGTYPNPHLSGAGVAFKLAWALAQRLSGGERVAPQFRAMLIELLPLAALGTIADVVPLIGENRVIAKHGLAGIPTTRLPGLRALMTSAGLNNGAVDCYDVGFKLAPRINAAGRMGHARLAVELFTRATDARAAEIAHYLHDHNRSRQTAERRIVHEACELVERNRWASDASRAIVAASPDWHAGVVGIAAARLVERFHRPTVLIAVNNGEGQGSARSVQHLDLAHALAECSPHLRSYGGHAMAAGVRLDSDKVDDFRRAFVDVANRRLTGADLIPTLRLDAVARVRELGIAATELILSMGPFGVGNPRPKLASEWLDLAAEPRCVGAQSDHLQVMLSDEGVCMKGIAFGQAASIDDLKRHRKCRVAFEPMVNDFNGRRNAEMRILDFEFPTAGH